MMMVVKSIILLNLLRLCQLSHSLEESSLTPLVPSNFYSVINDEKFALVFFQAPWCPHCKDLISEMNVANEELEELGIPLLSVDASEHRALASDLNVKGVPWLKLFINGEGVDYEGPRDAIGLVTYIREEAEASGFEIATPMKPKCNTMSASQDRGGNGGHNNKGCSSRGFISFGLCEQKLADSKECSALTFKKGECYLHDRSSSDHWSDKVEGSIYVTKYVKGFDKCV